MDIPSVEALFDLSRGSLQDIELAARSRAANLSKSLRHELDLWIEEMAIAMVARWMLENREALLSRTTVDIKPKSVDFLALRDGKKTA